MTWPQIIEWFENDLKWKKIFTDKHSKIDIPDNMFEELGAEIGNDAAKFLIPLLDQNSKDEK